jgi:hypothetical protein
MSMLGNRPLLVRQRVGSLICVAAVIGIVGCGGSAVVDGPGGNPAGASNSAGAGGSATEACAAMQEPGQCNAYIPAFWHNPKTGLCEPFVYGGCGGNANRYPSRDACIRACPAAADDWGKCVNDSNCALVSASCTELCDPVSDEQLVAVNAAHLPLYGNSHCSGVFPGVPCKSLGETEQTRKYFKPVCQNTRCSLIDIRESSQTECQSDGDCMLREGAACCAECDGYGWVSVNQRADLCGGAATACDDCTAPRPFDLHAVCVLGRCQLTQTP